MSAKPLSSAERKGFLKTGDLFLPGGHGFPAFSQTEVLSQLEKITDYLPPKDREDLLSLMALFGILPRFLIRLVLRLAGWSRFFPPPLGPVLRQLDFGLKGVFYTLYYSEESIFPLIHWNAKTIS